MKKLRTFAVSMIVAALGLLIYCGGFYIRSYKQNLVVKQGYEEIADIAEISDGKRLIVCMLGGICRLAVICNGPEYTAEFSVKAFIS